MFNQPGQFRPMSPQSGSPGQTQAMAHQSALQRLLGGFQQPQHGMGLRQPMAPQNLGMGGMTQAMQSPVQAYLQSRLQPRQQAFPGQAQGGGFPGQGQGVSGGFPGQGQGGAGIPTPMVNRPPAGGAPQGPSASPLGGSPTAGLQDMMARLRQGPPSANLGMGAPMPSAPPQVSPGFAAQPPSQPQYGIGDSRNNPNWNQNEMATVGNGIGGMWF